MVVPSIGMGKAAPNRLPFINSLSFSPLLLLSLLPLVAAMEAADLQVATAVVPVMVASPWALAMAASQWAVAMEVPVDTDKWFR